MLLRTINYFNKVCKSTPVWPKQTKNNKIMFKKIVSTINSYFVSQIDPCMINVPLTYFLLREHIVNNIVFAPF